MANHATLRQGSTGADVALWQDIIGVPSDAKFGPATVTATKAWQKAHNLTADGIVGPASWAAGLASPMTDPVVPQNAAQLNAVVAEMNPAAAKAVADIPVPPQLFPDPKAAPFADTPDHPFLHHEHLTFWDHLRMTPKWVLYLAAAAVGIPVSMKVFKKNG